MPRKMVVSPQISRSIGSLGLPRETLLDLLAHVYDDIALKYSSIKHARLADASHFLHRFVLTDKTGVGHLFIFEIDDTTSPDHLWVVGVKHRIV